MFKVQSKSKGYYASACKECTSKSAKADYAAKKLLRETYGTSGKVCTKCCGTEFYTSNGFCKSCVKIKNAAMYAKDIEKSRQRIRDKAAKKSKEDPEYSRNRWIDYYQRTRLQILDRAKTRRGERKEELRLKRLSRYLANPEKYREISRDWSRRNKDSIAKRRRKSYEKNKEKFLAKKKAWQLKNKEKCRVHNRNRRDRIRNSIGSLSPDIVPKLMRLQKGLCPCCKEPLGKSYHIDHIMPIALGGSNTDNNVQLLRAECNLRKHAKHPIDYMQSKGFLL